MNEDVRAYESAATAPERRGTPAGAGGRPPARPQSRGADGEPAARDDGTAPAEVTSDKPRDHSASPEETERLFEEAVRHHSRRLLAIARAVLGITSRASPEDVVQQALTNLYQHRARYDWHEPGGLLKRSVVNEALRILRQPKMSVVGDEPPDVYHEEDPADVTVGNETVRRVRQAIARLPEHYRAALVLCEYEQMPYAEIATTLQASIPQVKTWIFRARRQLATMLKDYASAP